MKASSKNSKIEESLRLNLWNLKNNKFSVKIFSRLIGALKILTWVENMDSKFFCHDCGCTININEKTRLLMDSF